MGDKGEGVEGGQKSQKRGDVLCVWPLMHISD